MIIVHNSIDPFLPAGFPTKKCSTSHKRTPIYIYIYIYIYIVLLEYIEHGVHGDLSMMLGTIIPKVSQYTRGSPNSTYLRGTTTL